MSEDVARRWVGYLTTAFPNGRSDLSALSLDTKMSTFTADPDDEHVCALAIAGEAQVIFTFDQGYDRDALRSVGVEVMNPDEWLAELANEEPLLFRDVILRQAMAWGGGRTVGELLSALDRARVSEFVAVMRAILEV